MSPNNKPGICLLTETYHPVVGGGERQARALASGLAQQGFGVTVVTRRSDAALLPHEAMEQVAVYRVPPTGKTHLKKWALLLTTVPALWAQRRYYDLIFVSGFRVLGITAVILSKLLGKKCVLKADSLGEMSGDFFAAGLQRLHLRPSSLPFRLFLALRNAVLRRADAFVAISSAIAEEIAASGVSPQMIHCIPNSVDVFHFRPVDEATKSLLRQKQNLSDRSRIVVYTGRLVSYKGLPALLRVWKEIQEEQEDVRLLLVGAGGLDMHNCEAELKQYVRENQLQDSVHFTGAVPDVREYLQLADIFAFPTQDEAFGISLVEGMACGLAVVGTSVGGVQDIIEDKHNGLVVPPDDAPRLREALTQLLQDPALRKRLGTAAVQTVRSRYTSKSVNARYAQLFTTGLAHGS
jgi:glycosyltransferase involved in cell wall biosynthesis